RIIDKEDARHRGGDVLAAEKCEGAIAAAVTEEVAIPTDPIVRLDRSPRARGPSSRDGRLCLLKCWRGKRRTFRGGGLSGQDRGVQRQSARDNQKNGPQAPTSTG